ncbi:hypothetical protein B0H11DRAFT_1945445 [Mycena galericulata]|nr:hypothetical protein B0H11DRAFT_1945445 [Mycena galericulata]
MRIAAHAGHLRAHVLEQRWQSQLHPKQLGVMPELELTGPESTMGKILGGDKHGMFQGPTCACCMGKITCVGISGAQVNMSPTQVNMWCFTLGKRPICAWCMDKVTCAGISGAQVKSQYVHKSTCSVLHRRKDRLGLKNSKRRAPRLGPKIIGVEWKNGPQAQVTQVNPAKFKLRWQRKSICQVSPAFLAAERSSGYAAREYIQVHLNISKRIDVKDDEEAMKCVEKSMEAWLDHELESSSRVRDTLVGRMELDSDTRKFIANLFPDALQTFKGILAKREITPLLGKLAFDVLKIFELLVNDPAAET